MRLQAQAAKGHPTARRLLTKVGTPRSSMSSAVKTSLVMNLSMGEKKAAGTVSRQPSRFVDGTPDDSELETFPRVDDPDRSPAEGAHRMRSSPSGCPCREDPLPFWELLPGGTGSVLSL